MSNVVIKIENLSKLYRLGKIGTGTLSHDLNRWLAKIRGKDDPYLKVGTLNDRTKKSDSPYAWALKDINFEVNQGEVVGIIGKNGAGKSTLLKLLSRVSSPTTGSIKAKGRIASLLEVGTGFHPELSGKENIYLNGAILGMTKSEIKSKFEEIVEFSGCAKYIDTPTKRYSSGMTVRLAFAVAAFLESEILIVDEVLAVGDAEFQQKAIGKMKDVSSGQGRTVLFVSHNMGAVQSLCSRGILLANGQLKINGTVEEAIEGYITNNNGAKISEIESNGFYLTELDLFNSQGKCVNILEAGDACTIRGSIKGKLEGPQPILLVTVTSLYGDRLVLFSSRLSGIQIQNFSNSLTFEISIDSLMLMPGNYEFTVILVYLKGGQLASWENYKSFEVYPDPTAIPLALPSPSDRGIVYTRSQWNISID